MKKLTNLIISLISIFMLVFLFVYYNIFPSSFKTVFIFFVIFISILILYNYLISFGMSQEGEKETFQDFLISTNSLPDTKKNILFEKNQKQTITLDKIINEILYPLQIIETSANYILSSCENEGQKVSADLIQKNIHTIKEIIGEKIYSVNEKDGISGESIIPLATQNISLKEELLQKISIGIFGTINSETLTLRLILQSYGFFTKIIDTQQEALSSIEDYLIQILIVTPESENDDAFSLCLKIREKFTLLDFPVLAVVNKYRSHLVKKCFESQINDFLVRPFDVSALIAKIHILCDYRQLYMEKQELVKSEKEKRAFLYFVTHNVNTPLTVLLNEIEKIRLSSEKGNSAVDEETLGNIYESSRQINIIIQNVLNSYKISDGKYLVSPKILNLKTVVEKENVFLRQKSSGKNQEFIFEVSAENPRVFCDENSLKGIYVNLVDNAVKYTPTGGKIKIIIHTDETSVYLSVCDNGQGIPKERQAVLFNRFASIGSKTELGEKSVGLGLFVAGELCSLNNISLSYSENQSEESGSIFTLKFPKVG